MCKLESLETDTADGGVQTIRFKDGVHHLLNSPFVRHLGTNVYNLIREAASMGWRPAFARAFDSFDLAGEGHACEALGLEPTCLEDWSEVKRAHRALVLEYHPDKHGGADEAELEAINGRFRAVQEAYEHLSFCMAVYRWQVERGAYFIHEHPWSASSWKLRTVQAVRRLPGVLVARVQPGPRSVPSFPSARAIAVAGTRGHRPRNYTEARRKISLPDFHQMAMAHPWVHVPGERTGLWPPGQYNGWHFHGASASDTGWTKKMQLRLRAGPGGSAAGEMNRAFANRVWDAVCPR